MAATITTIGMAIPPAPYSLGDTLQRSFPVSDGDIFGELIAKLDEAAPSTDGGDVVVQISEPRIS
ncbi:hypothetical protein [Sphingomonas hylomeconis]|uniref:hypothetical protein n=1 Tax=Sphingomonas hylomeconis TaxID=1395958 RepID=UPI0036D23E58